ncbi:NMDA receptor synaptonuclear signaling and neuronal migration factor isoform X17 [Equus quagga]|uniref:NMDA receptor synaptonuclear signaling and neuronal migration factor isoform X17 n=1 Tax=Equus quagga TaxID=89248 RepID=UPI001EE31E99|nr:NMDA receptor synaptonuclear signaling and neuronal migration factor isoform X17 [Equus quagga]
MGAAASRRRALRSEAMSSVAAKVRAARAFGEYLSQSHPENRNGADHLLADAYSGHDGSPEMQPAPQNKRRLSLVSNGRYEGSLSEEAVSRKPAGEGPQPRVYTISGEPALLPSPDAEAIELAVVKGQRQQEGHPHHHSQSLRASPGSSREDVSTPCQSWAGSRQGSKECPGCAQLAPGPSPSLRTFGLDQPPLPEATSRRKKLERMYSVDRVSDDVPIRTWFPKETLFSFHTATTTMQANFRKHLRMVGSRRVKAQSSDLQSSHCTLGEAFEDLDWETEKGLEAVACDTEGFLPPKVMLISSKVPKAEYIPTIIRRDDPSIIPILYAGGCMQAAGGSTHTSPSPEEIEKKLNIYHKGAKIWKMLIFCQGGPGHLYLLKNKVATFAKVEKEEDMIHFWKRLSRLMSKVNPEPNVIHIMGCYILGNPNGEKLFQNLRTLMTPYRVTFESPLELSAQGPGISSYTSDPAQAGESLKGCLEEALALIPKAQHQETPMFLGATAGMRLLSQKNSSQARDIFAAVTQFLSQSPVDFRGAELLAGQDEGALGWITINYVLGMLVQYSFSGEWIRPPEGMLVGALDMGGASTQITFVPGGPILDGNTQTTLRLYGLDHSVYTHSYLCFGRDQMLNRLLAGLVQSSPAPLVRHPCYHSGYQGTLSLASLYASPCVHTTAPLNLTRNLTVEGTGNPRACISAIRDLFDFLSCEGRADCAFNGVYQPPVRGQFYAFSNFYYTLHFLNLTSRQPLATVNTSVWEFCQRPWKLVEASSTGQDRWLRDYCASGLYILTLLLEGYGFSEDTWPNIEFRKQAGGTDIGWTLGYMLNLTNMILAEAPAQWRAESYSIWVAGVVFMVLTLVAILGAAAVQLFWPQD